MDKRIEEIARSMGFEIIGDVPEFTPDEAGAAKLARFYQQRMAELRRQETAAQVTKEEAPALTLSLSEPTVRALAELARLTWPSGQENDPVVLAIALLEQLGPVVLGEIKRVRAGNPESADREIVAEEVGLKVMQFLRGRVRSSRQAG